MLQFFKSGHTARKIPAIFALLLASMLSLSIQTESASAATLTGSSISEVGGLAASINANDIIISTTTSTLLPSGGATVLAIIRGAAKVTNTGLVCQAVASCTGLTYTAGGSTLTGTVNFMDFNGDVHVSFRTTTALPANTPVVFTLSSGSVDLTSATGVIEFETYDATWNTIDSDTLNVSVLPPQTVTFDGNGATGQMNPQSGTTSTALNANTFTRTGFTFSGWSTLRQGGGTSYSDGSLYAFSNSITLYAQWAPVTSNSSTPAALAETGSDMLKTGAIGILLSFSGLLIFWASLRRMHK